MARRLLALVLAATLAISACDPFEDQSGPTNDAPASSAQATGSRQSVQGSAEVVSRALTLLSENYVEGADLSQLLAASQRGAWQALAEVGVPPSDVDAPPQHGVLVETMQGFRQRFVRTAFKYSSKVEPSWLAYEMIRRAADSLDDCHTGFLTPKQVQEQVQRLSGTTKFGGIGVLLRRLTDNNEFTVVEVFENSPAAKAGLRPGDRIVSVDGTELSGLGIEQVVGMVRGPEGSSIHLGVARTGSEKLLDLEMTRASVSAPLIRSNVLDGNIGYVKFYGFPEPLTGQLDAALRDFAKRQVRGVIVDLRDNSGGQLDVVTKVTSRFVPDGPIFQGVSQTGERTVFYADGSYWGPRPLVVLVNSGTGSGGEIFASAVKEHRVGKLIGAPTSGCVSTGQMFQLPDGSAIEIATNRVISGLRGAELNKVGVAPDEVVQVAPTDLANQRDAQLTRAVQSLLHG